MRPQTHSAGDFFDRLLRWLCPVLRTRHALARSAVLIALGLIAGCATSTGDRTSTSPSLAGQATTLLSGASIDEARSVAMGSARGKGWTIQGNSADSDGYTRLVLERDTSATAPQAIALGTLAGYPGPRIRVEATFVEQPMGTEVGLKAFVIVNPGSEAEQQIEYTQDYQTDLAISLSALQSAWLAAAHRVASQAPVPETPAPPAPDDILGEPVAEAPPLEPATPDPATGAPVEDRSTDWAWREPLPPEADIRIQTPVPTDYGDPPAPPELPGSIDWPANDIEPQAPNPMMALGPSTRIGIWAYYAERYAEDQGCALAGPGAVLLQKTAAFELHEVSCANGANLLVKCQGGICRSVR